MLQIGNQTRDNNVRASSQSQLFPLTISHKMGGKLLGQTTAHIQTSQFRTRRNCSASLETHAVVRSHPVVQCRFLQSCWRPRPLVPRWTNRLQAQNTRVSATHRSLAWKKQVCLPTVDSDATPTRSTSRHERAIARSKSALLHAPLSDTSIERSCERNGTAPISADTLNKKRNQSARNRTNYLSNGVRCKFRCSSAAHEWPKVTSALPANETWKLHKKGHWKRSRTNDQCRGASCAPHQSLKSNDFKLVGADVHSATAPWSVTALHPRIERSTKHGNAREIACRHLSSPSLLAKWRDLQAHSKNADVEKYSLQIGHWWISCSQQKRINAIAWNALKRMQSFSQIRWNGMNLHQGKKQSTVCTIALPHTCERSAPSTCKVNGVVETAFNALNSNFVSLATNKLASLTLAKQIRKNHQPLLLRWQVFAML